MEVKIDRNNIQLTRCFRIDNEEISNPILNHGGKFPRKMPTFISILENQFHFYVRKVPKKYRLKTSDEIQVRPYESSE